MKRVLHLTSLSLAVIGLAGCARYQTAANTSSVEPVNEVVVTQPTVSEPTPTAANSTTECTGQRTPALTEGPYYKSGAPIRTEILAPVPTGELLILSGTVFDQNCQPIAGAALDFWQADGNGEYDNEGYEYRGVQMTDAQGSYRLATVIPGEYPGRTPHIHVKVRPSASSSELTTQIFVPGVVSNATDSTYLEELEMDLTQQDGRSAGTFNFVVQR